MFKKHYEKRSHNILFVTFRLFLSIVMFVILLGGIYQAYKHFSGLDPVKLDLPALFNNVIAAKTPQDLIKVISAVKLAPRVLKSPVLSGTDKIAPASSGFVPSFRFLLVADTHNDNRNLEKAISQAKQTFPDLKFIIGLGDYSEVGTIEELNRAKKVFDDAGLRYFLIPGDHDLWDSRNRSLAPTDNFQKVFGPNFQTFNFDDFSFLLLDNSDNYTGLDKAQFSFLEDKLAKSREEGAKAVFVFMHEPLYHPSSDHVMGWVEKSLKSQAEMLLFKLKEGGATKIFSGDIHYFSQYQEPKTKIEMFTIGAVSTARNPQVPRFAVIEAGADGSVKVKDVEIR